MRDLRRKGSGSGRGRLRGAHTAGRSDARAAASSASESARPQVSQQTSRQPTPARRRRRPRSKMAYRMRRKLRAWSRIGGVVLVLMLISWGITAGIRAIQRSAAPPPEPEPETVEESMLAPLPFAVQQDETLTPRNIGPDITRTALTAAVDRVALPECGQVETTYFSDAAFLGDSITEGLTDYEIDLAGALVCGYRGASPNQIANRTSLKHTERGEEVALDVLKAAHPSKLYVLIGTNALGTPGGDDTFLAYYGKMLDEIKTTLPGTAVYVQSLMPVRPEATAKQAGLDNKRFAALNREIAAMALERGMYYLDLWEEFADDQGNLREDVAQPDGIHMTVSGYQEWVGYLTRHTVYQRTNPYLPGSDYATT